MEQLSLQHYITHRFGVQVEWATDLISAVIGWVALLGPHFAEGRCRGGAELADVLTTEDIIWQLRL